MIANTEAEQALIGCAYLNTAETLALAGSLVDERDFFDPRYRTLWDAAEAAFSVGRPADIPSTKHYLGLKWDDLLMGVIADAVSAAVSTANVEHFARMVRDASVRRQIHSMALQLQDLAQSPTAKDCLAEATRMLAQASGRMLTEGGSASLAEVVADEAARVFESVNAGRVTMGLSTGFPEVDDMTGGMMPGDFWILAARPSMGKTSLAMDIADAAAQQTGVLFFSAEMRRQALAQRYIARQGVNLRHVRQARLDPAGLVTVNRAAGIAQTRKMWINDTPSPEVGYLRTMALTMAAKHTIGLVVVDYLQLLRVRGFDGRDRNAEVTLVSATLKALAGELGCPVLCLSQLNRELEKRPNKRPVMSDLRDSGSIEQDADVICFPYRDVVYDPRASREEAELIFAKQRNEELGTVKLRWNGPFTRFSSWDTGPQQSMDLRWGPTQIAAAAGRIIAKEGPKVPWRLLCDLLADEGCSRKEPEIFDALQQGGVVFDPDWNASLEH